MHIPGPAVADSAVVVQLRTNNTRTHAIRAHTKRRRQRIRGPERTYAKLRHA